LKKDLSASEKSELNAVEFTVEWLQPIYEQMLDRVRYTPVDRVVEVNWFF